MHRGWGAVAAAIACAGCAGAGAQELDSPLVALTPWEALRDGDLLFELRPRYTWVDQDGRPEQARGGSVRTLLGWKTLEYRGFAVVAEGIDVARFSESGAIAYTSTPAYTGAPAFPGYSGLSTGYYPLLEDPDIINFNRLYLDYVGLAHTLVRVGRQLVPIDNQRFVGDYEFGQLPQSFVGALLENTSLPRSRLTLGYFARVRNAFAVQTDTQTTVVNARYEPWAALKIAGYGYLQNQPRTGSATGFADNSNQIFGGRVWGGWQVGAGLELLYSAELADQSSYAGGNALIDASYQRFGAGAAFGGAALRVDWEQLGSNHGLYGFQTPLGSTALFTGQVNMFATTPTRGLEDSRAHLTLEHWHGRLRVAYHSFRSDWADWDLGSEWDVGLEWSFTAKLSARVDYGDYRAGDPRAGLPDTRKLWVTLDYKY